MELTICKIEQGAPFHMGTKETILEETSEYIHSDTLFSAICNAYRLLYGKDKLEELLNLYINNAPPFLLSSAFPYIGGSSDVLLFPLPKSVDLGKYVDDRKKYKKVELISKSIFLKIISGEINETFINDCHLIQDNRVLIAGIENIGKGDKKIWASREVPRVAIDSITNTTNIYHVGEVVYSAGCGLYFLIDFKNPEFIEKVKSAIRVLGDEGIGGERTYGKGLFKVKNFELIKFDITSNNNFVTLSLYYPGQEELNGLNGDYDLVKRGGWIYSIDGISMRRKTVRMFVEGSVFEKPSESYGKLISVTPLNCLYKVYRYGYAFPIPCVVKA
jgi:CRISPR-associated protein Csm4